MKIPLVGLLVLAGLGAHAQGTVYFANISGTSLNLPVFHSDGVLKVGPPYVAGLMAGKDTNSLSLIATTPVLSGYFIGGTQTISTVPAGAIAWLRVIVWNTNAGATFEEAQKASGFTDPWGETSVFSLIAGDPSVPPPLLLPLTETTFIWGTNPSTPPALDRSYDSVNGAITLTFTGTLETSTDLVTWTNVNGPSPQTFPANQPRQYFRSAIPQP
jgi:hypothetical protein